MQLKVFVLATLAAAASAQSSEVVPESVKASVLNVLITALPTSVLAAAATNQPAFISDIVKSISASQTPDWYKPLPSDVKSLLTKIYPVAAPVATTASSAASSVATTSAPVTASTGALSSSGLNSTTVTSINTPTLSSTSRVSGSSSTPPPSNGAAYPTAAFGSSIVGAFGVLGLFLL
ncbi:hypothetical protein CC80DRAFT_548531 [Byssothecium circinans]|uniref:Uncharacterized protein n=1 Tax=Byssothecium circinans TaxID=147558 RepID=A0A6A5TTF8_9PLEO|nr:hypothetical protein CC80DRAFT_548531 [Byssothecium circinans]